jgi:hypothetical protein
MEFLALLGGFTVLGLFFLAGYALGYVKGGRAMLMEVQARTRSSKVSSIFQKRPMDN